MSIPDISSGGVTGPRAGAGAMGRTYEEFLRANAARGGHDVIQDGECIVVIAANGDWCRHRLGGDAEAEFNANEAAREREQAA